MPVDVTSTLSSLAAADTFFGTNLDSSGVASLTSLSRRWSEHFRTKRFQLSIPLKAAIGFTSPLSDFWTNPLAFHAIPTEAPELLKELQKAQLVIFKVFLACEAASAARALSHSF